MIIFVEFVMIILCYFNVVHALVTVVADHTAAHENQRVAVAREATASHHVVKSHVQEARFVVHAVKAFKDEVSTKKRIQSSFKNVF